MGRISPDLAPKVHQLLDRLYDHIPAPAEALFRWIETPLDGRVPLWREIPAGRFQMGSPDGEGEDDERPRHEVEIRSPYRIGAVPVTNAQYAAFDPDHEPEQWEGKAAGELPHYPVASVTWYEAVAFCRWLSSRDPLLRGARPPFEEEWEYACRAGTETRYWSGDSEQDLAVVGWYAKNSGDWAHVVGEKPANPWGLYDVHGNVWEWTASEWHSGTYTGRGGGHTLEPMSAIISSLSGAGRVIRGGCFLLDADWARAANRLSWRSVDVLVNLGFRVVLPSAPER